MSYITKEEYKSFYNITDDSQNDLIDAKIIQAENLINDRLNIDTFNIHNKTYKQPFAQDWFYKFKYIKINDILKINNLDKNENIEQFNYSIKIKNNDFYNEVMTFNLEFWYTEIPYLVKEVMYKIVNFLISSQNQTTVAWFDTENIKSFKQGDLSVTLKDWTSWNTWSYSFYLTKNLEDEIKRLYKFIWKERSKIYHN